MEIFFHKYAHLFFAVLRYKFPKNANSGLKENRKGRKQGKLSSYKKIDEVTHGRYNKTVLFGR
ncbi:hypothetical protein [Wolbachia endosymbiont (group A) of Icerya purchasi]|uniref:hypothetical protein n=1 Tax=Wolbachia endosymbiont (group A) of Icerya purchasi TaxID=2954019 RepID=UPI00222F47FF|nr:hypothetical protein [Wolbachia endosymbiont (group A) of Icerya purchasi]